MIKKKPKELTIEVMKVTEKRRGLLPTMAELCTLHKLAARLNLCSPAMFNWMHRCLGRLSKNRAKLLNGIVETDETYFLESFKSSSTPMPRRHRDKVHWQELSTEQGFVLVACNNYKSSVDFVSGYSNVIADKLVKHLLSNLSVDVVATTSRSAKSCLNSMRDASLACESKNVCAWGHVRTHCHLQNTNNLRQSRLTEWTMLFQRCIDQVSAPLFRMAEKSGLLSTCRQRHSLELFLRKLFNIKFQ